MSTLDIWAENAAHGGNDDGEWIVEDIIGDPFLNSLPGFSPTRQWGRKGRGRPSSKQALLPVSQQADIPQKLKTRPPGVEVKHYLDELKNFCLAEPKQGKSRRLRFDCPKGRDFDPFVEDKNDAEVERDQFDLEKKDSFQPCLFDIAEMEASWKEPIDMADKPKRKLGRPRKHPVKEKVPGRPRGRPRKYPEGAKTANKAVPKPKSNDPRMIFTFEDGEADEDTILEMISKGYLVMSAKSKVEMGKLGRPRIHAPKEKVLGRPRGRPRKHPPKEKVAGRPRGRPRVLPAKEKVPGRPRGRPRIHPAKEKVPGRPRGRPRGSKKAKPKVIFSFGGDDNEGQVSADQIKELRKQGVKVVDVGKKRRGRKKKVQIGADGGEVQPPLQEQKKRGRKKKIETEKGSAEAATPKKRGCKKKIAVVTGNEEAKSEAENKPGGAAILQKETVRVPMGSDRGVVEEERNAINEEGPLPKEKLGRKRKLDVTQVNDELEKLVVRLDFGKKKAML